MMCLFFLFFFFITNLLFIKSFSVSTFTSRSAHLENTFLEFFREIF